MKIEKIQFDITWSSLFKILALGLVIFCLFYFSKIWLWLLLALIISFLFNPLIDILEKKRISRPFAATLVYFVFLILLFLFVYLAFPPLINELVSFVDNFSVYVNDILKFLTENGLAESENIKNLLLSSKDEILSLVQNTISFAGNVMGEVFAIITIFMLALFLSIEKDFPLNFLKMFAFKKETENLVVSSFNESRRQVVGYFNAKIVASIFVAVATTIFCSLMDIKYGVSLGIISGVLNIVPMIGPILSCLLIAFFAFFDSWLKVAIVVVFCILLQQIESNLLVPILTKKIIGIPIVLVLLAILIGAKIGGVLGAIFIIPVVGIIYEFIRTYLEKRKKEVRGQP